MTAAQIRGARPHRLLPNAPRRRTEQSGAPAAASSASSSAAAASSSVLPPDADDALRRFQRRGQQTSASEELAHAAVPSDDELLWRRLQASVILLLADADRKDGPMIDLNYRVEEKGTLLMVLIQQFARGVLESNDEDDDNLFSGDEEPWDDPALTIAPAVPHLCALIRASYDPTIKGPNGKDALALLVCKVIPKAVDHWSYLLAEALLDRGADVNTRFTAGWTPLIHWCAEGSWDANAEAACGPLLLPSCGADIDARDDEGWTAVHWMAVHGHYLMCKALADAGWIMMADLTLVTPGGETPLQIAQRKLGSDDTSPDRRGICSLLREHARLWKEEVRPLLHQWLSHSLLLPDVADIVLSYVDGKKKSKKSHRQKQ
jgi:hypothetical protein